MLNGKEATAKWLGDYDKVTYFDLCGPLKKSPTHLCQYTWHKTSKFYIFIGKLWKYIVYIKHNPAISGIMHARMR